MKGIIIILVLVSVPLAYGDIGIDISQTCKVMLVNSLPTTCPTLDQIMVLFPDTSPKHQVGDFETIDSITQRGKPQYNIENMNNYFRGIGDQNRIWINPPAGIKDLKMIIIESNFEDYPLKGSYKMENNTIVRGTERYVSTTCNHAIINAANWIFLTGDTIKYIQSGCTVTNFDHIKKTYYEPSYQDITTSYKHKLDKWIKESMVRCKLRC